MLWGSQNVKQIFEIKNIKKLINTWFEVRRMDLMQTGAPFGLYTVWCPRFVKFDSFRCWTFNRGYRFGKCLFGLYKHKLNLNISQFYHSSVNTHSLILLIYIHIYWLCGLSNFLKIILSKRQIQSKLEFEPELTWSN